MSHRLNEATTRLIELYVEHSIPAAVSRSPTEKDHISVKFDEQVYFDAFSQFDLNDGMPVDVELPRQSDAEKVAALEQTAKAMQAAGTTLAASTTVLNIFLQASLKLLWGLINTL